jgi:ubiquinone/menaquinone biosynthesis C-methylase UbiE
MASVRLPLCLWKSEVRARFDAAASDYAANRDRQQSFLTQKAFVLEMLGEGPGRVLDIGCGPALMSSALIARGFRVWGIDASAEMIRLGRERFLAQPPAQRPQLQRGDAERLPFAHGSFDAVICMGALEYLPDYGAAIHEMHRVLRAGGIAVITVPSRVSAYHSARSVYDSLRRVLGRRGDPFGINRCVPWQLDRRLQDAGFAKVDARSCNFIFFPLYELHRGLSEAVDRRLAVLAQAAPGRLLGAQYVVKAMKLQSAA